MPKISIVIPVYNVEKYITQCLESVQKQTFKDFEVIIIDDGSPDESYKIYQRYADNDCRFKIVKKQNAGVSEARNTGIEEATGDFVMFIDSDDWMEETACEVLYNEALKNQADLIVADAYTVEGNVRKRIRVFKDPFVTSDRKFIRDYQRSCLGYAYNPMPVDKYNVTGIGSPWNKLFRRSVIVEHCLRFDPYVKGIFDDNLFTMHFLSVAGRVSYVPEPVYDYRIVSQSLTQSYKANTLDISRRIFERIEEFISEQEDPDFFKKAYYMYVIRRFSAELNVYYFAGKNPAPLRQRLSEMKRILRTEPYRAALQNVEGKLLMPQHKFIYCPAKIGCSFGVWLALVSRRWVKEKLMQ